MSFHIKPIVHKKINLGDYCSMLPYYLTIYKLTDEVTRKGDKFMIDVRKIAKIFKYASTSYLFNYYKLPNEHFPLTPYEDACEIFIRGRKPFLRDCHKIIESELSIKTIIKASKEAEILANIIEILNEYGLEHILQYKCGSYKCDMYIVDKNIVVEVDEHGHVNRDHKYEADRMEFINKTLKCRFFRVNPDEKKFTIRSMSKQLEKLLDV